MPAPESTTTAVPPPPLARPAPDAMAPLAGSRPRSLQVALFLAAVLWFNCARALAGSAADELDLHFALGDLRPLTESLLLLLLVVFGLSVLRSIEHRRAPLWPTLGFPRRATAREEWATGAAIGWGLAVASVLPMALARTLSVQVWTAPRAFWLLGLSLLTLAAATLAYALAIYGYGFQRLIEATGPTRAALILVALVAIEAAVSPTPYATPDGSRILVAMAASLLLCLCWFRTHGLWLLWGLHFAWAASTAAFSGCRSEAMLPLPPSLTPVLPGRHGLPAATMARRSGDLRSAAVRRDSRPDPRHR